MANLIAVAYASDLNARERNWTCETEFTAKYGTLMIIVQAMCKLNIATCTS